MRSRRVVSGGHLQGGAARGDAPHCDALGDLVAQLGHVGDDADGAPAGAQVVAPTAGRVAFADWLKGYGLIVILEHGDGYMSLYAQNDSLLKEVGDWVAPGEALAGVGSSGGHSDPALYFELRLNGRPVDPKAWFAPQ